MLNSKTFYITPDGDITYSVVSETLKYVVGYMSKPPVVNVSVEELTEFGNEYSEGYVEVSTESLKENTLIPLEDDDLIEGYHVDDAGNFYRVKTDRHGKEVTKKLKLHKTRLGYLEAILTKKDGKKKHVSVHRAVAIYHLGIPEDETMTDVNHIDGDRANVKVNNLEWMTHSDNVTHSYKYLRNKDK